MKRNELVRQWVFVPWAFWIDRHRFRRKADLNCVRQSRRYLFTTLPTNDLGLVTRALPIACELRALGNEVLFCSPGRAPHLLVEEAGFENTLPQHPIYDFIDVEHTFGGLFRLLVSKPWNRRNMSFLEFLRDVIPAIPLKSARAVEGEVWDADHAGAMMGMLNEGFVRANCEAFRQLIEQWKPDVVVDFWNPFAVIAARSLEKPVITVIQGNAHPQSDGFVWWSKPTLEIPTPVDVVNRVMQNYGLDRLHKLSDLNVGDLTLVVGAPETDPIPGVQDGAYIGAVLWQQKGGQLPAWMERPRNERPLIWAYSGNPRYGSSSGILDSEIVISACVEGLAHEDVDVVLTTGHHPIPKRLSPLPANFHHERYVPGLLLAEKADLLVHHGGYGSCQMALYSGKPSVILPTYSERLGNARRIEALGAAIVTNVSNVSGKKEVRIDEFRAAVHMALSDASYRVSAARLGDRLRTFGGARRAAQLIDAFSSRTFATSLA